jgi:hypothetical protein
MGVSFIMPSQYIRNRINNAGDVYAFICTICFASHWCEVARNFSPKFAMRAS